MHKPTVLAVATMVLAAVSAPVLAESRVGEGIKGMESGWEHMMLSERLKGDDRMLADAYSRAAILHTHVIAGDWKAAEREVKHISGDLDKLSKRKELNAAVKTRVGQLAGMVRQLDTQIRAHDNQAITTARDLVARFGSDLTQLASEGALGTSGGGAGTTPKHKNMNR